MATPTSHPSSRLPLRSLHPASKQSPAPPSPFSLSRFLFKGLFLAFLLLAVPFFPSQAPAFLDNRVFPEFWELLHLLVIGVAVSYGLFSRRNLGVDGPQSAQRHAALSASRVADLLPIFEDGYEFSCGSDGKIQRPVPEAWKWDSGQYSHGESKVAFSNESGLANEEQIKSRSLSFENVDTVLSSWSSQCFQCEPMVVVAQPNSNCGDECCKPLGLPVRSLKSRTGEPGRRKSRNGGGSGPVSSSGHSSFGSGSRVNGDFGDAGPVNFDKFDETVAVPSDAPMLWQSRSGRMQVGETFGNVGKNLHARHIPVEESRSRHHRSRSFRSNGSLTSHTGSASSSASPDKHSPSHSASSDLPKMGEPKNRKDQFRSSRAASPLDVGYSVDASGSEKGMGRNLTNKDDDGENVTHGSLDSKSTFYSSLMNNRNASPDMSHSQRYENILLENLNDEQMDFIVKRSQEFSSDKLPVHGSHSRSYTSIENFNDEQMDFSEKRYEEFLGNEIPLRGSHSRSYTSIEKFNDEQMDFSEKRYEELSGGKFPPLGSHSRSYTSIEKSSDERMDLNEKSSQEFSGEKLPPRGSHSRSYTSVDTFLDPDGQRKLNGDYEDPGGISRENLLHRRRLPQGSLKLDVKPRDKNIKGMLRGKSVRTFRASRRTETVKHFEETRQNFIDEKVGMKHEKTDQFCSRKEGNKTEGSHSCLGTTGEPILGNASPVLQQELANCANGGENHHDNKTVNSGGEWMAEAENPQRRLDKEAVSDTLSEAGTEANEVDKKAGEFIAKFREQIRLQKMASIDGSISIDFSEDDYR